MIEVLECKNPDEGHTIWYWIDEDAFPQFAPYSLRTDNREDAVNWVREQIENAPSNLRWIKVFRTHNEFYTCLHWKNPRKHETRFVSVPVQPYSLIYKKSEESTNWIMWMVFLIIFVGLVGLIARWT